MNKIKKVRIGDFFTFRASHGLFRVIFCTSLQDKRSPIFYNFSATVIKSIEMPNIDEIRSSYYYGKGNQISYKHGSLELNKIYDLHPEVKPYSLGTYELMISRKEFMSNKNRFELIVNLSILEKLNMNGNGGMNADDFGSLDDFFVTRIDRFMEMNGQKKYLIEAIIKAK